MYLIWQFLCVQDVAKARSTSRASARGGTDSCVNTKKGVWHRRRSRALPPGSALSAATLGSVTSTRSRTTSCGPTAGIASRRCVRGNNPQLLDAVPPTRYALEQYKTANEKMTKAFNNRLGKMKGLHFDGNDNDHKAAVERISKTSRMVLLPRWKTFRQMTNIGFCGNVGNFLTNGN